jgi:hypothetical protein
MAKESNVIQFPSRGKSAQAALSEKEISENVSFMKHNHINETLNTLVPMIFNNIELAGFHLIPDEDEVDENLKDSALMVESLRSLLCKHYGMKHPFQKLAEEIFIPTSEGAFTLSKALIVDFEDFKEEGNSES